MGNKRQELLKTLIENLIRTVHNLNTSQSFPFGDRMLSKQQIMIVFFVYDNKGATSVKEIAKFLHVTSGAVTQFVDSLVKNRIVKREENSLDRRSINIKLTSNTEKRFDNFRKKYIESASKSFAAINDQGLKRFIGLIDKIKIANR